MPMTSSESSCRLVTFSKRTQGGNPSVTSSIPSPVLFLQSLVGIFLHQTLLTPCHLLLGHLFSKPEVVKQKYETGPW